MSAAQGTAADLHACTPRLLTPMRLLRLMQQCVWAGVCGVAVGGTPEYMAPETLAHLAGRRCAADLCKAGTPRMCLQHAELLQAVMPAHKRGSVT